MSQLLSVIYFDKQSHNSEMILHEISIWWQDTSQLGFPLCCFDKSFQTHNQFRSGVEHNNTIVFTAILWITWHPNELYQT